MLFPKVQSLFPPGLRPGGGCDTRAPQKLPAGALRGEEPAMPHFCTCQNTACRCHPSNHDQGCDLCIQKELRKGEIPSCFFNLVIRPGETVEDCTIQAFARRVLEAETAAENS